MVAVPLPLKFYDGPAAAMGRPPLLGGRQEIIDDIRQYRDAGVHYIVLDLFYSAPKLAHETIECMFGTIERFAAEVMPEFRD
jgi:hypothetical protein